MPKQPTGYIIETAANFSGLTSGYAAVYVDPSRGGILSLETRKKTLEEFFHEGKEGYVVFSFTINEIGGVEDIKVLEAKPKRVFNKEAKRALRKWKYKPKIVDGKAQRRIGLTVRIDFKMGG